MKKTFLLSVLLLAFVVGGFVSSPGTADASCSKNGYMHSGGKCGVSFKESKHDWDDDDDDEDEDEDDHGKYWKNKYYYTTNTDALQAYINQLLALLAFYEGRNGGQSDGDADVRTLSATSIDENEATLRAIVDMNDDDEAELYFEYGTSAGNLRWKTDTRDLDSSDDGDTQEETVDDLDDGTRYYFRAVVIDEDGDKDYGMTYNFVTEDDGSNSNNDEEPSISTGSATSIDSDSATLRGSLDMNDFENGEAFFVFGEDRDQVADVEDDFDSYSDVDEDGDDLRKVSVDSDADDTNDYTYSVGSLDSNTDIFFSLCVEYEDEDNDNTLICGSIREFTTD